MLRQIDADFRYIASAGTDRDGDGANWPSVQVTTARRSWPALTLGLIGEHQACNAAVAVAAVEELSKPGVPIGDAAVASGLARVHWPARLEIMARRPLVLLDCASQRRVGPGVGAGA